MPTKLKVLISAYACEPNKGSEPEVGWQWALQMAKYHDVTVLTRTNNRATIEKEVALLEGKQPLPKFFYHDEAPFFLWLKKRFNAVRFYYVFWQISAARVIEQLNAQHDFDVLHHVTFAGFRYRTAIWNQGVPSVWGPVGGVESIPWDLLPWKHPQSLLPELARNVNNFIQSAPFHVLPKRAQETTVTLVSTEEMERAFHHLGLEALLMPTIGLHIKPMLPRHGRPLTEPLRFLFVGNVITLKGIDLSLHALKEARINAVFTIVGDGPFLATAKRMAAQLGLEKQVIFRGRVPRSEALNLYPEHDVFLFPSLHDTGGYAVIEAMACGLPVVCLDCGGPRVAVKDGAGVRVPLISRKQVISGIAEAMRGYARDREMVVRHGLKAREVIVEHYDWEKKGEHLNEVYLAAAKEKASFQSAKKTTFTGTLRNIFNRMFPVRGLAVSALILFIVGAAGFLSLNYLKRDASAIVEKTLPELSSAGAANSSLAESFNRTLLLAMAETPEERAGYRKELDNFNQQTEKSLELYRRKISTREQEELYDRLMAQRKKYVALRERVLQLVDAKKSTEALALCKSTVWPAYLDYKSAAEKMLNANTQEGRARGDTILKICTITQYAVAGAGILLFAIGFTIGLLK